MSTTKIDFSKVVTAEAKAAVARARLIEEVAGVRWEVQSGGVTLEGGLAVRSDQAARTAFTETINALRAGLAEAPVPWKFDGGWRDLTLADLEEIAGAISRHTTSCFAAERSVQEDIAALPDADVAGFDVRAAFDAALAEHVSATAGLS